MQGLNLKAGVLSAAVAGLAIAGSADATVILNDTFANGSVINPASYPAATSNSAGYTVASTKGASSSIASGDLKLGMASTTSGFSEVQSRFSTSAASLSATGDYIEVTAVFTATANLLAGNSASGVYMGLYNSGGSDPASGSTLAASGLNTTASSAYATGNAANWQGYAAKVLGSTGSNSVYTRPLQNGAGTTSANQDLLGNAAGGGLYNNPTGTQIGGAATSSVAALTNLSVYTSDLIIALNGDGSLNITSSLYSGSGTGGTSLATQTVTTGTAPLTTSFDGLALGYRASFPSGAGQATQIDYNSITVSTGSATPEPASLAVLGIAGMLGLRRRA